VSIDPNQLLSETTFAVLDVETTGLSPAYGHRICEVACLRVCGGVELDRFESLVNLQRSISPGAFASTASRQRCCAAHSSLPPTVAEALESRGRVRMSYVDARGLETDRVIRPLRVDARRCNLYLIAHCYRRGELRTFRLDRVVEMALED